MEPRLPTSKRWTPLPSDLIQQMTEIVGGHFKRESGSGEFRIEGRVYPQELLLRFGYLPAGSLSQKNFEFSFEYQFDKEKVIDLVHLSLDMVAGLFTQLFENPEESLQYPVVWQKEAMGERTFYIQFSGINSKLEQEADKLLGEQPTLVTEAPEDPRIEEVLSRIEEYDIPPDDEKH